MISNLTKMKYYKDALPYIRKFEGKIFVIKYGGAAMTDSGLNESFTKDVSLLKKLGIKIVIVHGGGNEITELSNKLNVPVKFVNGLRYTDKTTMEIAQMVLAGKINKEIVLSINKFGGNAVGICGIDADIFKVKKLIKNKQDLGFVGNIVKINSSFINLLLKNNYLPVIAPIGSNNRNESFNINADDAVSATSCFLKAEKLIYVSDVSGIIVNGKLIRSIDMETALSLIKKNIIKNGMIPKIMSAFRSISSGVKKVHIIDGRVKHSILTEIFTDKGVGTEIVGSSIQDVKKSNFKDFNKIKLAS